MQFYGNWSPDLVPDAGRSSVGLEYFASKGDALWSRSDGQMLDVAKQDLERLGLVKPSIISDGCVVRYQKAYPIYDIGYAVHLGTIRKYLAEFSNLQCIGRAGQFRYNNMDHSIFTGMLAVRKIGGQDVDPWSVNEDAAYLEAK
jgi:protoporphyrinogen oxidase